MRRTCFATLLLLFVATMLLVPAQIAAQAVYGNISGTVSDPQGAAVPNAKITVTNIRKGTVDTATSNEQGNYQVIHLIPDIYDVKVEAQGFAPAEVKNITISADTTARVDPKLTLGGVSQTVEVTAEAPQLKTDRADVATIFNERAVTELPILNRNFTQFELLTPGTQKLVGWNHASTENPQGSQQIFVNGQHFSGTAFELDGTDNQDPILGIIVVNPTLESVTETKITTQNYDAEFGKAIAGIVTAQTKSGSNALHGSGFWFRRSDATSAKDRFTGLNPPSMWNQFGGSLGGPIIKDKLFFFGDYQGTRRKTPFSNTYSLPTDLVRSTCLNPASDVCDLSQYLQGGARQIYAPNPGDPLGANPAAFPRILIPGNVFSKTTYPLAPASVAILSALPAPNFGDPGAIASNFVAGGSGPFNDNAFNVRGDYQFTSNTHIFGRYSEARFDISGTPNFGPAGGEGTGQGGLAGQAKTTNRSLATGFDLALSPTLLTDFRLGYFRYNVNTSKPTTGTDAAAAFGFVGLNQGDVFTSGLPYIEVDGLAKFGEGLNVGRCNCPLTQDEHQYQFVNNWTKIIGNHSAKFGADIRFAHNLRVPSDANRTGQLVFHDAGTSLVTNGAAAGGLGLASMLFGQVNHFERYTGTSTTAAESQKRMYFYGQDTWRATQKLTLNYGLRWELYWPESVNGKGQGGFGDLEIGGFRVAGYGPYNNAGNIPVNKTAFAPRLGIAYQITPKTVVRMGYGRSFDIGVFGSIFGHTVTQNLPVLANQSSSNPDYQAAFLVQNGPPAFVPPTIPDNGVILWDNTYSPKVRPNKLRLPTLDAYNITIQHQITSTMSAEIGYVGNKGTHVFAGNGAGYNLNQASLVGFGTLTQDQRKPFYQAYNGGICCTVNFDYRGDDANNNYNALQAKLNKNFGHGLQFLAHYTWSKAMNYTDDYYAVDPVVAYGRDDFNRAHVFVFNAVYELPFGRGKTFGGGMNRIADALVGGWQISTVTNWSSGEPFGVSYANCNQDRDTGPCRPNYGTGNVDFGVTRNSDGTITYFTPQALGGSSAFADPDPGTFGNIGRNPFTGPRFFSSDMSFSKKFAITERVKADFRADAFNIFNHPVLGFNANAGNRCVDCVGSDAGRITGIENGTTMRQWQFGVKLSF